MLALAAHLGMTVRQMIRSMTVKEFAMWRLEYGLRPWGERRADIRSAQVCAILANIHRDSKQHPKPYPISDFLLFEDKVEDEDAEDRDIVAPDTVAWFRAMAVKTEAEQERATNGN